MLLASEGSDDKQVDKRCSRRDLFCEAVSVLVPQWFVFARSRARYSETDPKITLKLLLGIKYTYTKNGDENTARTSERPRTIESE